MSKIAPRLVRWSITSALLLTTMTSAALAQAADMEPQTTAQPVEIAGATVTAQVGSTPSASIQPERVGDCSFSAPCVVSRSAGGWVLDYGGPGLYFQADSTE